MISHDCAVEALIHDEVLLRGEFVEVVESKIDSICEHAYSILGFQIQTECKNTHATTEDLEWFESHKIFVNHIAKETTYDGVKATFEHEVFKIFYAADFRNIQK